MRKYEFNTWWRFFFNLMWTEWEKKRNKYTRKALFFGHDGVSPCRKERKKVFFYPISILCYCVHNFRFPLNKIWAHISWPNRNAPENFNILDESPRYKTAKASILRRGTHKKGNVNEYAQRLKQKFGCVCVLATETIESWI